MDMYSTCQIDLSNTEHDKPIIQLSVRGSYSGWALGVLGPIHGYKIQVAYPNAKNFPKSMVKKLESLPIELVPQRPNMMSVVLGQTKKYAKANDLQMIPYGFDHQSYLLIHKLLQSHFHYYQP